MSFVAKLIGGPAYAGLATLGRHWKLIGIAVLLAAVGIQQLRVTGLKSSLSACHAGRLADQESYKRAQAEATALAIAAKAKKEAEYEAEREKADLAAADLGERYRAAVLRYAAAQGKTGRADLSVPAKATEVANRSDRLTVFPVGQLMIPEEDAFKCGTITARLVSARGWALSLDKVE